MGLGLKNFFGLDWNETVWFAAGYKFRNDSENFRLVRNEFQSETFAREVHFKFILQLSIKGMGYFTIKAI